MQPDDEALWMRYVEERAIFEKMRKLFRTFFLVVLCFGAVTCIAIIPKACSELGPGGHFGTHRHHSQHSRLRIPVWDHPRRLHLVCARSSSRAALCLWEWYGAMHYRRLPSLHSGYCRTVCLRLATANSEAFGGAAR